MFPLDYRSLVETPSANLEKQKSKAAYPKIKMILLLLIL